MRRRFEGEQYFEDFVAGDVYVTEPVDVTEAEILEFARRYDPQPFHLDREAARRGPFGELVASGWHTAALTFGHLIRAGFLRGGGWGAGAIEGLKWKRTVRPGDRLTVEARVKDTRPSASRPDRGYVTIEVAAINQDGEEVLVYTVPEILKRRDAG